MAITLTQRAQQEIEAIAHQNSLTGKPHLRLGIKEGGCSGMTYVMDLCDGPSEDDEIFPGEKVNVVCDIRSFSRLDGTEVDFLDNVPEPGFFFKNPNARGTCNCGASFNS